MTSYPLTTDAFLSDLAHDLKQPLVAISNLLYLIQEDSNSEFNPQQTDNMKLCISECQKMHQMVDQLNVMSEIQMMNIQYKPVRLGELIEQTLKPFDPYLQNRNMQVNIIADQGEWMLPVELVSWALSCLIDNAIEHGSDNEEPLLNIICNVRQGKIDLSVLDNGHGVSPMEQHRIFRPFHKATRRQSQDHRQTPTIDATTPAGMGLALANMLMHRIGGALTLESMPMSGAHFKLSFPLETVHETLLLSNTTGHALAGSA